MQQQHWLIRIAGIFVLWNVVVVGWSADWPGWRGGTRGDGISTETEIPWQWGPNENIAWKTKIPGRGHSSPIIYRDRVFVTSAVEETQQRLLLCLDRLTGRILWEREVFRAPFEPIHQLNSRASATPATDGERVFVSFLEETEMVLTAYNFAGEQLWQTRPGPFASKHGYCSCPVVYQNQVIVNGDHDGPAYLVSLDRQTGRILWKTPRENNLRSYCTPIVTEIDGQMQLLLNGSLCTAGYDVHTGQMLWTCDGPSEQMVATLVHGHGLIFSLGGYPERHLLAIRKGGRGDITDTHIVWRTHKGIPYVPSPILYGDLLHVVSDEGFYTCFDPTTGTVHNRQRLSNHVSSSLVAGCDRVYITEDRGITTVLANRPKFTLLAKNSVGEDVYATPAIAWGNIYLRGTQHLFCIGPQPSELPTDK